MTASARMELDDRGVLTVTLSRPEQRNPLDVEAWRVLGEAFGERAHTPGVRAVVLRGEGDSFCSGLDRSLLVQVAGGGNGQRVDIDAGTLQGTIDAIDSCPVPTLAVIQGACVGGGLALMLACDLRVAADDAFFVMMEMRYAFLPDLGHIPRLLREVGMARATARVVGLDGTVHGRACCEVPVIYPRPGWVEQDAEALWDSVLAACRELLGDGVRPAAMGITNQRETVVVFERDSLRPVAPAI